MNQDIIFDTERNMLRETPGGKLERISLSQLFAIAAGMRQRRAIPKLIAPLQAAATFVRDKVTRRDDGVIEIPVPRRMERRIRSHGGRIPRRHRSHA